MSLASWEARANSLLLRVEGFQSRPEPIVERADVPWDAPEPEPISFESRPADSSSRPRARSRQEGRPASSRKLPPPAKTGARASTSGGANVKSSHSTVSNVQPRPSTKRLQDYESPYVVRARKIAGRRATDAIRRSKIRSNKTVEDAEEGHSQPSRSALPIEQVNVTDSRPPWNDRFYVSPTEDLPPPREHAGTSVSAPPPPVASVSARAKYQMRNAVKEPDQVLPVADSTNMKQAAPIARITFPERDSAGRGAASTVHGASPETNSPRLRSVGVQCAPWYSEPEAGGDRSPSATEYLRIQPRGKQMRQRLRKSRGTSPFDLAVVQEILALDSRVTEGGPKVRSYENAEMTPPRPAATQGGVQPTWSLGGQTQANDQTQQMQHIQLQLMSEMTNLMRAFTEIVKPPAMHQQQPALTTGMNAEAWAAQARSRIEKASQAAGSSTGLQSSIDGKKGRSEQMKTPLPSGTIPQPAGFQQANAPPPPSCRPAPVPLSPPRVTRADLEQASRDELMTKIMEQLSHIEGEADAVEARHISYGYNLSLPLGSALLLADELEDDPTESKGNEIDVVTQDPVVTKGRAGQHKTPGGAFVDVSLPREEAEDIDKHVLAFRRHRRKQEAKMRDSSGMTQSDVMELLADDIVNDLLGDCCIEMEHLIQNYADNILGTL
jgi:hypothetical protein